MLCNSTCRCDARLHSWRRRWSRSATSQMEISTSWAQTRSIGSIIWGSQMKMKSSRHLLPNLQMRKIS
ncbi:unnamed protein product [Hymenolepis diminuta]|uniref:Uncharacterized protein n=1 Tax=Hymenolepis diminuta TaxID=6216 RepID=A0A564YVF7_HYMDI|nr:unnamed protein product [Hymenolepis diminuta]